MMNWMYSFGASSNFQKYRLSITTLSLDAPNERDMKNIMKTFLGEDEQTRSQIGFATIIKKLNTSKSKQNWIYLLKNLLIFQRLLSENIFLQELSELDLPTITQYTEKDSQYIKLETQNIVKKYWNLIKERARLKKSKYHIFYYTRATREDFLSTLTPELALKQMESIQLIFTNCFNLISSLEPRGDCQSPIYKIKSPLEKSKLISYLYLQLLFLLITLYSCELLCINRIIGIMGGSSHKNIEVIKLQQLKKLKTMINRFKFNANEIVLFVNRHKQIKGFEEVNYRELDPFKQMDPLTHINEYIKEKTQVKNNAQEEDLIFHESSQKIVVERRPIINKNNQKITLTARKEIVISKKVDKSAIFSNWVDSYCEDFPQKQVLTVDLMVLLRKEEEEQNQINPILTIPRQSTIYNYKDALISNSLEFVSPVFNQKPDTIFSNVYSTLPTQWIQT